MRKIFTSAILPIFLLSLSFAGLKVTPSTTLSAETGNNTSASDSFPGSANDNPAPGNVSKVPAKTLLYAGANTKLYVHLMSWFDTVKGYHHGNLVGYNSDDPAQVQKQVTDMASRGYDGAIIDWYGPGPGGVDDRIASATLAVRDEAERHPGFEFAVMDDAGTIRSCSCDINVKVISDLTYAVNNLASSPAYMRRNGRPVIFFFGMEQFALDWQRIKASVPGNPIFIQENAGGFTFTQSDGSYGWPQPLQSGYDSFEGLAYLDDFYSHALQRLNSYGFGSTYKGFNDIIASWAPPGGRHIKQFCGKTWLDTWAEASKYYNPGNQLQNMQVATWSDYEEGTEIETGIDNCVSISASSSGSTLNWAITGDEATLDHYTVFVSLDGANLMPLTDVAAGTHALDLSTFGLDPGAYTLYVKAVGKPSLFNHTSQAVNYAVTGSPASSSDFAMSATPNNLSVSAGQTVQLTLALKPHGSFNQPIALACAGAPAGSSCTLSSSAVTPGSNTMNVTVSITAGTASVHSNAPIPNDNSHERSIYAMLLPFSAPGLAGLILAGYDPKKRKKMRGLKWIAQSLLMLTLGLMLMGCGSASSVPHANLPASTTAAASTKSYTLVFTGTSSSTTHTTTASITVH